MYTHGTVARFCDSEHQAGASDSNGSGSIKCGMSGCCLPWLLSSEAMLALRAAAAGTLCGNRRWTNCACRGAMWALCGSGRQRMLGIVHANRGKGTVLALGVPALSLCRPGPAGAGCGCTTTAALPAARCGTAAALRYMYRVHVYLYRLRVSVTLPTSLNFPAA